MNNELGPSPPELTLRNAPELDVVAGAEKVLEDYDNTSFVRKAGRVLVDGLLRIGNEDGGLLFVETELTNKQHSAPIQDEPIEMHRDACSTLAAVLISTTPWVESLDGVKSIDVLSPSDTLYVIQEKKKSNMRSKVIMNVFENFSASVEDGASKPIKMNCPSARYVLKNNRMGLHLLDKRSRERQKANKILNLAVDIWDGVALLDNNKIANQTKASSNPEN